MMSEALRRIEDFRRQVLQELLDQCTEPQKQVFERMYGTRDAKKLRPEKVNWAIQQCETTVNKNKKKGN